MRIRSSERLFICGKTQTGKSYLAKYIFRNFKKGIVYDSDLEHSDLGFVVTNMEDFKIAITKHSKVVYQPKNYGDTEFIELCRFIFNYLSNVVFMVDEIADLAPNNSIPDAYSMIIRRGAKRGIGSISITQRVAEVHKTTIAQAEHIISFYQFLDNDVNKLKQFLGSQAEQTKYLEKYHFLYFNDNKIEIKKPIS